MDAAEYAIGELARRTGTKVETIRWYERNQLMPQPARTAGGRRVYRRVHLDRLAFIRHARELGFPLDDVRALLRLTDVPEHSCAEADRIARAHLAAVRGRITRLQALEAELARMVADCGQGRVADCRVIEVLADHSHANCLHPEGHGGPEA
ncbi:MAG: helix-turn-helix domain-containing protein [Rhodospirillales bacterium]|nr:helix-turn-helix domain-containing protein [Rhodospirillales bacterium]MBN8898262.1 helix-turn-helix domain-containing protein [Rhodospirillales bacterium]MBN8901773.1 helix-turn-helix domain-containing protein [Rhodospirillales bacterium]